MSTLVEDVAQRIGAQVAALTGAIDFIADLASLIQQGALPQREVCAFVIGLGFDGGKAEAAVNAFTQGLTQSVGVVLCVKALGDAKAQKAVPTIDALSQSVIEAVAGWGPSTAPGVFTVSRGRLLNADKGLLLYQIDFALVDQLRIVS